LSGDLLSGRSSALNEKIPSRLLLPQLAATGNTMRTNMAEVEMSIPSDLPLKFHPVVARVFSVDTPSNALSLISRLIVEAARPSAWAIALTLRPAAFNSAIWSLSQ
jgi:hypothetical protein